MSRKLISLVVMVMFLLVVGNVFGQSSQAQFGKNNVRYNSLDQHYESYRFDIWHNLDPKDPAQMEYLRQVVENLEGARDWMSGSKIFNHSIEKRIPILFYKTHTDMESSNLVGGFMPEGVGAFVEFKRGRMVLKADFSKPLGRAIGVHELVHEYQRDIESPGIIQKAVGAARLPSGFYEGCAEFLTGLYDPHTRDDIRRREQRSFASNPKSLPTWGTLNSDAVNPYTMWSMIPEFLEDKFSGGVAFCTQPLKNKVGLGEFIYDLTKGELGNPDINSEKFDQHARHYWGTERGFEVDRINRPKPYEENDNFKGWTVTPYGHPYPMLSPILSPDGSQIAAFTFQKNGVALVRYTIPEETVYLSKEEREKAKRGNVLGRLMPKPNPVKSLTPQLPPVPWEYLIVQGFETWPFNGSDASWSRDGKKIAFFARINRDHALVVIEADTGKVLNKIELESPSLDQAFSPSFNSDGSAVVFSAVKNITRDLYLIDLESRLILNLTNDERFDTAPAISPDGSQVAYVGSEGDFQHLFLLHLADGRKEQLTFGGFNDSSPSWSDDGSKLVYTSDEANQIWNLYTLDLATRTVSQWTEFIGQVGTPLFARGSLDKTYSVVFHDDDQYRDVIYSNFEIFEIKLKKPIRQYTAVDTKEPLNFAFNPNRDIFKFELDSNQFLNPKKAPEQWACGGGNISFGVSTYWGMFGQSYIGCSNILETKEHVGFFASYGDFRVIDYSYRNQEKRTSWSLGAHNYQLPLYSQFYDIVKRYPKQTILNETWMEESSMDFYTQHPINKFNRWELFSRLRYRSFNVFGYKVGDLNESMIQPPDFNDQDVQMYRFLKTSNGSNLGFGAAYVRDTVLYSPNTWGPWHGNAFRAQFEVAPPMGKEFGGYVSTNIQARTYKHLGSAALFAGRVDLMASSRANGEFMLLCGPDRLRGCEYGSIAGNQVAYGSAELRFPILDAIVAPGRLNFGGVRGFFFADGVIVRFSDEKFLAQKVKTYGFGLQYIEPLMGWPLQFTWRRNNGKWAPTFYVSLNW